MIGKKIIDACPTNAITKNPVAIDLGKCIFCGECERASNRAIRFSNDYKLAASKKDHLVVASGASYKDYSASAIDAQKKNTFIIWPLPETETGFRRRMQRMRNGIVCLRKCKF